MTAADKYSCDMEDESSSESCVIKQDSSDDFDWTRQALETPSGRQVEIYTKLKRGLVYLSLASSMQIQLNIILI